jgi:hypothetical protein
MLIIVTMAGLAGFLASVVLLHWQLHWMWLRYGLSVALAYGCFLVLLQFWISRQKYFASAAKDLLDNPGAFAFSDDSVTNRSSEARDRNLLDWVDFDLPDFDEGLVIFAFLVAIVSALFACGYVIYSAPSLFAEVLVDAALSVGLYRRVCNSEPRHWVQSVLRRTGGPFAFALLFFVIAGGVAQMYAPEAVSIGGVLSHRSVPPSHPGIASDGSLSK